MRDYDDHVESIRQEQFPMLKDDLYLDHAGTTLYSKKHLDCFHSDMMSGLYGNPHSASPGQQSMRVIDSVRLQTLELFHADPENFDLVFTANATAAMKMVADAFKDHPGDFRYAYHVDSHTSLVGIRQAAVEHRCLTTEEEIDHWLAQSRCQGRGTLSLLAYPAQSNMNGRRLPLVWIKKTLLDRHRRTYSLLDAAAYASTSPLYLDEMEVAPDFTIVSFSKIFGFPNLGGLIVKKTSGHIFDNRKYFGGGTVDMVVCLKERWHIKKSGSLHEQLEDGTLPIHGIMALGSAIRVHRELFGTLEEVARHTGFLAQRLYSGLMDLRHWNGRSLSSIHKVPECSYSDLSTQGPIVAFNLKDHRGAWVSNAEVEKLASIKNIHLRTGGLCNPGGIASCLELDPWEMIDNFSAGFRCGGENDVLNGKPTGVIRASLGAMSTVRDVDRFLSFIEEFFVQKTPPPKRQHLSPTRDASISHLYVESLAVYPIKSCSGWQIPLNKPWELHNEGLAWDREWCIIKSPCGTVLSQKNNRQMALIRPELDFEAGVLRIGLTGSMRTISVPLSHDPAQFNASRAFPAIVCGDSITARAYTSPAVAEFFTSALGLPCTLARFPSAGARGGGNSDGSGCTRHSKPHLGVSTSAPPQPLLLSNESPILTISRTSLNRLNETIQASGGQAVPSAVFRANIVLAEGAQAQTGGGMAWAEDGWDGMRVGGRMGSPSDLDGPVADDEASGVRLDFLGGCRRCQMVCVDPESGERNQEPFVTLAKTRRFRGRVLFGVHTALARANQDCSGVRRAMIKVGDSVAPFVRGEGDYTEWT